MSEQLSAEEREDVTLADLLAAHRVERLGFPGLVKCHACDDWTEGTIHDHHAALAASWYEAIAARLAAVEALIGPMLARESVPVYQLRAALHPDPSEAGA